MPNDDLYSRLYPSSEEPGIFPPQTPVAMAYVPLQRLNTVYEPDAALEAGTLFPELNQPFLAWRHL